MVNKHEALRIFQKTDGARREGRLENVQQRKKEIQKVYTSIQHNQTRLIDALKQDLGWDKVGALLEITTVLQFLRILFDSLDLKAALQLEYDIEKSTSDVTLRTALGNVLIVGEDSSPIAQAVAPLCVAVAEGNSAVLLLSPTTPETSALLLEILNRSLDVEAVVTLWPSTEIDWSNTIDSFREQPFDGIVVQKSSTRATIESLAFYEKSPHLRVIYHAPDLSVVIVTRNADIPKAAQSVAQAKFSFYSGPSATRPRIVLIDEFVLDQFLTSLEKSLRGIAVNRPQNTKRKLQSTWADATAEIGQLEQDVKALGVRVFRPNADVSGEAILVGGPNWSIEKVHNIMDEKTRASSSLRDQILSAVPTTSLEAMLAITNKFCADAPNSSVSVFSNGSEARYLSLFLTSTNIFVNHTGIDAMITPFPQSTLLRLRPLFCRERIIHAPATSLASSTIQQLQQALSSGKGKVAGLEEIISRVLEPPKQKSGAQKGFFPQGGLVGMGHIVVLMGLLGTGIGIGVFYAARSMFRAKRLQS